MQLFSATQEYFAAVSEDNRVKVWDVRSGAVELDLKERDHLSYKYTSLAWARKSPLLKAKSAKRSKAGAAATARGLGLLAIGTSTGAVVVWDLHKGEVVQRLTSDKDGHSTAVLAVAFNSQGNLLYSCASGDKHVLEWNVTDATVARKFRAGGDAQTLAVSPQDEVLAVGGTAIRTFDLSSGKKARKLVAGLSSTVSQLAFSPCKRFLFSSTVGGRFVNMYDLAAQEQDEPVLNFSMPSSAAALSVRTATTKKKTDVLLAAVSSTGALFVWQQKFKAGAKSTKPVTPDAKSVGEAAGILHVASPSDEDDASPALLLVRGSLAKPVFETVALVDEQQQLRSEIEFAPISEHLLLGENASHAKKQKVAAEAADRETTHVPALAARSGLATAKDVVDASTAAGDFDDLNGGDDDDDETNGLTLAERVDALRERVETDLAAEMVRAEAADAAATTDASRGLSERPDASSLSSLLEQALQSKDNAMLEYCLRTRDAKVIANTIKRVASVKVLELLDIIVLKFEKSPGRCARLCPWIRSILLHHTAYLMTQPDLVQSLSALYQILENRLKVHDALQRLSGRLSLVIGQIHEASYTNNSNQEGEASEGEGPRAKIVYKEGVCMQLKDERTRRRGD
jgi:U3 small nucleolar RNA-associated protein 5